MPAPLICLMGPTASGKTQLAVKLVQDFPVEIISVDSAMIYRGLDIGTAKPSPDILKIAPHHLINLCDPCDAYSAAQFRQDALRAIAKIVNAQKIPLLVGGTMLYFRVLQQGLADLPPANAALRAKLTDQALRLGWPFLHAHLMTIDPLAAKRIHPHDGQRIQRALEVYELTGKNLSIWQQASGEALTGYQIHSLAVAPQQDRAVLHARIAQRFKQMLAEGLIAEVECLMAREDLTIDLPAIRSVGYRQVWQYLLGQYTFEEMQERGIIATRQLAKRQLTWLRSWPEVQWFDSEAADVYEQVAEQVRIIQASS